MAILGERLLLDGGVLFDLDLIGLWGLCQLLIRCFNQIYCLI